MKYPSSLYAKAFMDVLEDSPEGKHGVIIKNFAAAIESNGDLRWAENILRETRKLLIKKRGGRCAEIEYARFPGKRLAREIELKFSRKDYVERKENPNLVGGVRLTINGEEEIDNSFSKKMRRLFA